ncbi:MAG: hypothetical protein K0S21_3459 [Rhizobiaceae bacterium]|jgi:hypothetical protein|nr:hypothetical protein [Rhizobiaceae bacterium]
MREAPRNISGASAFSTGRSYKENEMFRSVLLWMLGIPIPIIILLWLFLD